MLLAGSTSLLLAVCAANDASGLYRFFRTDFSVDWLLPSVSAVRRLESQFVCSSITCNPLTVHDQESTEMTPWLFSHALLWSRLDRRGVLQLRRQRTCAQAIDIQYHSDKDTTTLSFQKVGTFCCLSALRQRIVIKKTGVSCSGEVLVQTFCNIVWADHTARGGAFYWGQARSLAAFSRCVIVLQLLIGIRRLNVEEKALWRGCAAATEVWPGDAGLARTRSSNRLKFLPLLKFLNFVNFEMSELSSNFTIKFKS